MHTQASLSTTPNQGGDHFQYPAMKMVWGTVYLEYCSLPRNVWRWTQEMNV